MHGKIRSSILIILIAVACTYNQSSRVFVDREAHYTFSIPDGWIRIPPNAVDEHMAAISKEMLNTAKELRTVVFQQAGIPFWSSPKLISINLSSKGPLTIKQLESFIDSGEMLKTMENGAREVQSDSSVKLTDIGFERPMVDRSTQTVWVLQKATGPTGKPLTAVTAMKLTCQGCVLAVYASEQADPALALKEARFLSTAVVIDESCRYDWEKMAVKSSIK